MEELLNQGLAALGIAPPEGAVAKMADYASRLLAQNKVMNLTAITAPTEVARLHFLDSAALLGCMTEGGGLPVGRSLIDVGTGAGFPGMVLKLLAPELDVTLLDSLDKRLNWLGDVCKALDLVDIRRIHGRAEEQGLLAGLRDSFDFATARAVADLGLLTELCLPFVKPGGRFLAMKGANCEEEISAAANAVTLLGGKLLTPYRYEIPGTDIRRTVVVVEKVSPTPKGYPRRWAKIQKAGL